VSETSRTTLQARRLPTGRLPTGTPSNRLRGQKMRSCMGACALSCWIRGFERVGKSFCLNLYTCSSNLVGHWHKHMDHPRQPPTLQRSPVHLPSERPACVSTTSSSKPLPVLVRFLITHRLVQAGCCMRRRADVYIDVYLPVLMRFLIRPLPVLMRRRADVHVHICMS
jgi:hypothetical protein